MKTVSWEDSISDFGPALLIAAPLASGADALAGEQILTSPDQALSITLSDPGGEKRGRTRSPPPLRSQPLARARP